MPTKRDPFFRLQAVLREGISGFKVHEMVRKSFTSISQRVLCLSLFKIYLLDQPPKQWNAVLLTMYICIRKWVPFFMGGYTKGIPVRLKKIW